MALQIDPLPVPVPSRADPASFPARGDATLGALPGFISQTNALGLEAEQNAQAAQLAASNAVQAANQAQGYLGTVQQSAADALASKAGAESSVAAASYQVTLASQQVSLAAQQAAIALSQANLASAAVGNGAKPYATYAAALADLANIATGQVVDVLSDETRGGQRVLYQDNGITLVYLRAVEMYVSPVPYVQSDSLQNMITKLLVLANVIPDVPPVLNADFSNPAYL